MYKVDITTADIQRITGKSLRSSQRIMQFSRAVYGKKLVKSPNGKFRMQPVTIKEFCDLNDYDYNHVLQTLKEKP